MPAASSVSSTGVSRASLGTGRVTSQTAMQTLDRPRANWAKGSVPVGSASTRRTAGAGGGRGGAGGEGAGERRDGLIAQTFDDVRVGQVDGESRAAVFQMGVHRNLLCRLAARLAALGGRFCASGGGSG